MIVNLIHADRRDNRPGLAGLRSKRTSTVLRGARAAAYTTSLMQADELWRAAKKTTPLASPILRYYAVMQAAQAVVASSPLANSQWQATKGHGLSLDLPSTKAGSHLLSLDDVYVSPAGKGMAAQKLAEALNSPLLGQRASLTELIAALPVQSLLAKDGDLPRRPLSVTPQWHSLEHQRGSHLDLNRVPPFLARVDDRGVAVAPPLGDVLEVLRHYPSLARIPRPVEVVAYPNPSDEYGTTLQLSFGEIEFRTYADWAQHFDIWRMPMGLEAHHEGLALPAVGGNAQPQHPLVTWFLVLYSFSILARYHGAYWRRLLDYDENKNAVPLRRLVDKDSGGALAFAELAILEYLSKSSKQASPS